MRREPRPTLEQCGWKKGGDGISWYKSSKDGSYCVGVYLSDQYGRIWHVDTYVKPESGKGMWKRTYVGYRDTIELAVKLADGLLSKWEGTR